MGELQLHKTSLELDGQGLHAGDTLEVCVLGSWLVGRLAFDQAGWYLLTRHDMGIRISPGLSARLVSSHANEEDTDPQDHFGDAAEEKLILVVEDDPDLGAFLVQFFREMTPYRYAVLATDATQALATARSVIPDFLLVDYWLPKTDGLQLYERLQAIPELLHVPALFMSAAPPRALHEQQMPIIEKPFALEELVQVIEKIGRSDRDSAIEES